MRKTLHMISRILFNVAAIVFGLMFLLYALCMDGSVASLLSEYVFNDTGRVETSSSGKEPVYYQTWYSSVEDVLDGNGAVAAAAEAEGAVLLKNDGGALPLNTQNDKVSLFGVGAYDMVYSLDGAGEILLNSDRQQYLKDELETVGVDVNEQLASWYNKNTNYWRADHLEDTQNGNGKNAKLNGANWSVIDSSKTASGYNTAIFVTGRITNEAIDLPRTTGSSLDAKDGDYLKLTDNELSVLAGIRDSGQYDKIILLINQATAIMENMETICNTYNIDAVMWIGYPGSDGLAAVADLLVGNSTPSGGLSDTWFTSKDAVGNTDYYATDKTVIIQEGVYLGYRYSETRYEDAVMGTANAGTYGYGSQVSYPFGYGLSYTTFSYSNVTLTENTSPTKENRVSGDDYTVSVTVTNTGSTYSGKEIVQIYLQQPYTATNKANGVEKPSVELVGYAKTDKLAPGEPQTLTIEIDANKYFAAYDRVKNGYVLDEGVYYLVAARNAHEAVNSILKYKNADYAESTAFDDSFGAGNTDNVMTVTVDAARAQSYEYWTKTGATVTNLFDAVDPNVIAGTNVVTYMSRSNWTGTADNLASQLNNVSNITKEGDAVYGNYNSGVNNSVGKQYYPEVYAEYEGKGYPTYGKTPADGTISLVEMRGIEYDEAFGASEEDVAKWETFLDQLSWSDTVTLVGNGRRMTAAIESISKPKTNDVNASNGISWKFDTSKNGGNGEMGFANKFDPENSNQYPTGYPCEGIIASSFNIEVAEAVGKAIGEDGLWSGSSGLYGFGLGLHRNPYHGRTGEYYSEDPYLTGMTGGYSTLGAQSKGLYVYNKHFVLNDQETGRVGYYTWLTEQTLRQIYLRPFEIAIEVGDAMNVMTSFNRVGSYWSGSYYNLMTKCLRGEFGMKGFAVTDWYTSDSMNVSYSFLAGNDLPDGYGTTVINKHGPTGDYEVYAWMLRQSAKRILYVVANSNAMNFYGDDTTTTVYDPDWYELRDVAFVISAVVFVATAAFAVTTTVWSMAAGRKKKN